MVRLPERLGRMIPSVILGDRSSKAVESEHPRDCPGFAGEPGDVSQVSARAGPGAGLRVAGAAPVEARPVQGLHPERIGRPHLGGGRRRSICARSGRSAMGAAFPFRRPDRRASKVAASTSGGFVSHLSGSDTPKRKGGMDSVPQRQRQRPLWWQGLHRSNRLAAVAKTYYVSNNFICKRRLCPDAVEKALRRR